MIELAAKKARDEGVVQFESDICDWGESHFYIPNTAAPIIMPLHQKAVLRFFFTRREDHHFPFQNIVYSTIKKSGKSTIAGVISRFFAETQTRYGEIYTIGNDLDQAKDRSFKEVVRSLELTPGYDHNKYRLPGRWQLNKLSLRCLLTGSLIKAIGVDAKGEAGGQQSLTVWTELWGAENTEARRFWDEMTPIPTVPDSLRLVETYAGYDGESELLRSLYDIGMEGHQLSAGELAAFVCREDTPGETFDDYVNCWYETKGDPEVKIPVWTNGRFGMYWDSGMEARRMPWQHMFRPLSDDPDDERICGYCRRLKSEHDIGIPADEYYAEQERIGPPNNYRRLHLNEWVGAEAAFIPMESWDACGHVHEMNDWDPVPRLVPGDRTMLVAAADAAVTGDCFGVLAVRRCPYDNQCVDVMALKKWDPADSGGVINLSEPEEFIRTVAKTQNIVQLAYDPYQMENTAQDLRRDGVLWVEPFTQASDRLKADSQLYDMIMNRKIHYTHDQGCPGNHMCHCFLAPLREHVGNANAKMQADEDSKLRIVKKSSGKKIDLTICLSMASARCLYLNVGKN